MPLSYGPHSLGQSVEWKQLPSTIVMSTPSRPHSLGQSVEWKPVPNIAVLGNISIRPHSLGQSVEWKLHLFGGSLQLEPCQGPTRWGNQLNGNLEGRVRMRSLPIAGQGSGPHSLGQSVEWKLNKLSRAIVWAKGGPTRWGNQLNGNPRLVFVNIVSKFWAPLAGAIS